MFPQRTPPINEGEVYKLKIESLGREGDGIAKVKNFVVIVPNTQVNDLVEVRITKVARRVAFGEVIGEVAAEDMDDGESEEEESEIDAEID